MFHKLQQTVNDLAYEHGTRAVITALANMLDTDGSELNDDTLRKAAAELRRVADHTLNVNVTANIEGA